MKTLKIGVQKLVTVYMGSLKMVSETHEEKSFRLVDLIAREITELWTQ